MEMTLSLQQLTVGLGSGETVLQDVSLQLAPGKILGLIGESGAGKSMIGAAIADTLPKGLAIRSGEIFFMGQRLAALPAKDRRALLGRDIAFIPQEPMQALNPSLSIGHQMQQHLARLGLAPKSARMARAAALLDEVGILQPRDVLLRYPHQLSGGMLQRVLIALAFAGAPRLVVADEPTTALDVTIQARVIELLGRMRDRHGTSVMFITHDLELASDICDEAAVLYAGQIVEQGPAAQVFHRPSHPYARGLALATPSLNGPLRQLYVIPGRMPGITERIALPGCKFAPRCAIMRPNCQAEAPKLAPSGPAQASACLYAPETESIAPPPLQPSQKMQALRETAVLRAKNLSKTYSLRDGFGRKREVAALHGLDFEVQAGEFLGVVGESGSGKSTLSKLIVGLEPHSGGTLNVADISLDPHNPAQRRRLAEHVQLIFQDPQAALNPRRRVGDLITQAIDNMQKAPSRQARLDLAHALLDQVMLPAEAAARFPDQLSGGQKQRVNIGRALGFAPKLLIADEIVSGLDVSVQAQILELLRELRVKQPFSMLLISHDLAVVRQICDRVLVMQRGRIVEAGPVETVFAAPQHDYTKALLAAASSRKITGAEGAPPKNMRPCPISS